MVFQIKVIATSDTGKMEERVNRYCMRHQISIKALHFPSDRVCVAVFDIPRE